MSQWKMLLLGTCLLPSIVLQAAPISLRNFREIAASLEMITGVSAVKPNVYDIYKKVVTRLPVKGEVSEMSSPMLLAMTELAGVFCTEMVNTQKTLSPGLRLFFAGVDFTKPPKQFTTALKAETFEELSTSFWQRNPSTEEAEILRGMFDELVDSVTPNPSGVEKILFMTCVQMATSVGFLAY